MRTALLATALALGTLAATPAFARGCARNVQFTRGSHAATLSGSITGYQTCDFYLNAREGQELRVWVQSRGPVEAMHMVDGDGTPVVDGEPIVLERNGRQTLRVGMPRAGARNNRSAVPYTIKFDIR